MKDHEVIIVVAGIAGLGFLLTRSQGEEKPGQQTMEAMGFGPPEKEVFEKAPDLGFPAFQEPQDLISEHIEKWIRASYNPYANKVDRETTEAKEHLQTTNTPLRDGLREGLNESLKQAGVLLDQINRALSEWAEASRRPVTASPYTKEYRDRLINNIEALKLFLQQNSALVHEGQRPTNITLIQRASQQVVKNVTVDMDATSTEDSRPSRPTLAAPSFSTTPTEDTGMQALDQPNRGVNPHAAADNVGISGESGTGGGRFQHDPRSRVAQRRPSAGRGQGESFAEPGRGSDESKQGPLAPTRSCDGGSLGRRF